ncbi:MAG: HIT domain-containing protein [Rhodothermales bacterium]
MWSPWRSQHIGNTSAEGLNEVNRPDLFRRIAEESDDEANLVVWRGDRVYVVMNRFPYNNGHLLIVPYRQVENYEDLDEEEMVEVARVIADCIQWLRAALEPEGFNVGMNLGPAGGAGVPEHLHVHVVPRWSGDTNFMPTVADIKIIPESMQDTFRKIREAVRASGGG